MRSLAVCAGIAILLAAGALPAASGARVADAGGSATCSAETKRLNKFKRGMKAAKRRYFKTHASKKARARFLTKQRRKLAALKRARTRCLDQSPGTGPPNQGPPGGGAPGPGTGGPAPPAPPKATSVIEDVISSAASFEPDELSTENGVEFVRTQLELELKPDATVAQLEALLARLDAEIVSSLEGVPIITVRIPDPGSLAALRTLIDSLAGDPALAHADIPTVPVTTELPSIVSTSDVSPVRPQLASKAYAAWNARAALAGLTSPGLVVGDYWGNGPPGPEVAVQETAADFVTTNPHMHGYSILGLLAGTFNPGAVSNTQADQVTGTWPGGDLPLRAVDLRLSIPGSTLHDRLLLMVQALPGDVVVNTSVADGCAPAGCTLAQIQQDALQWIARVRGRGLEDKFLHVSAAGNIYPNLQSDVLAVRGAAVNAAALMSLPGGVPNLANTLVVENTTASDPAGGPVEPVCMTNTSKEGGDISAVGNDIKSLSAPGQPRDLPLGGTSSAAPQVAGGAAMVWALDQGLTAPEVRRILVDTARPVDVDASADPRCKSTTPAPGLDQYSAVLAVDRAATQPVRAAILDVADANGTLGAPDGAFDENDLGAILTELTPGPGGVQLDYGRFDLNGNGYTGGGDTRMDLDGVRPVIWGYSDRRDVLGLQVLRNENQVRDLDVLCHEAAGPRYTGDPGSRDLFLEQRCLPSVDLKNEPAFPSSLAVGASSTLRLVTTNSAIGDAAFAALPGVRLELSATGGTVAAATGTTGPNGSFSTSVTRTDPNAAVVVTVTARAGVGGRVLDTLTVSAGDGASIGLQRRFTSSDSQCSAQAPDGQTIAADSVDDRVRIDEIATGAVSPTTSAATSVSGEGGSAGCSGTSSTDTTLTIGSGSLALDFAGSMSGNGNGSLTADQGTSEGTGIGSGGTFIRFRIDGAARPYTATGTFTHTASGSAAWSFLASVELGRRLDDGPRTLVPVIAYERSGDHGTPTTVPTTLSRTGTLQPGNYELSVSLRCAASGSEGVTHSYPTASCTQEGDFNLSVGSP